MRIGVIGPASTVGVIKRVVNKALPNIILIERTTEFFEESDALADELQASGLVDAILFTGPLNYSYVLKRLKPIIPWGHLSHSRVSIYRAFLDASYRYHSDLKTISVDTYDLDLIQEVLTLMGIKDFVVNKPQYSVNDPNLEHSFYEFHKNCYLEHRSTICFTSVEHVDQPLTNEGIPCIRILPTQEVVLEQIYNLQLQLLEKGQSAKETVAVIGIMYNYNYDNEKDLGIRELEKMEYRNAFKRYVYHLAQRLESAVFSDEFVHYYLVISKEKLEKLFLKGNEYANLLKFGKHESKCQTWIGIGIGQNTLEAKSRANMALNHSIRDYDVKQHTPSNNAYIIENEFSRKELVTEDSAAQQHRLAILANQYGLSESTLWRMAQAVADINAPTTAEELAQKMNITPRSVNRIIARLEDAGLVTVVGKEGVGKGRPARLLQIRLPQE